MDRISYELENIFPIACHNFKVLEVNLGLNLKTNKKKT